MAAIKRTDAITLKLRPAARRLFGVVRMPPPALEVFLRVPPPVFGVL